jgi:hypothetical protein
MSATDRSGNQHEMTDVGPEGETNTSTDGSVTQTRGNQVFRGGKPVNGN